MVNVGFWQGNTHIRIHTPDMVAFHDSNDQQDAPAESEPIISELTRYPCTTARRRITDKTILANRPDIVMHDRKEKTCLLIIISVPDDTNIMLKETEKISKNKDLEFEISRL
ncbi:hypothetical protein QQF64_023612 [Cirrhinus molitorella]|uniref:Uncharacterized protein n=1 Tax=Cirrhinus molitorella TaxID=172907 RepID=A0ABR3NJ56_9TELE